MHIKLATQISLAGAIAAATAGLCATYLTLGWGLSWFSATLICLSLGLIAGLLLRWYFRRNTRQISNLIKAMDALSGGDFEVDVRAFRSNSEVQMLVDRFSNMRESMQSRQRGLKRKARLDRLTGLFNRAYLEAQLPLLENWAVEKEGSLSALMLDLDNFKAWNDGLGHAAGDRILKCVAANLQMGCRETDLITRLGGDEFVVIGIGLDLVAAASLAERLRQAIYTALENQAKNEFGGQDDERAQIEAMRVTVSVGVAVYNGQLGDLLENADSALYEAKRAGRNQVKVYNDAVRAVA